MNKWAWMTIHKNKWAIIVKTVWARDIYIYRPEQNAELRYQQGAILVLVSFLD